LTLPTLPTISTPTAPTIPGIPTSWPASIPGGYQDPSGIIAQQLQTQGLNPNDPQVAGYIASIQQAAMGEGYGATAQEVISRVQTFSAAYNQVFNNPSVASVSNAVEISLNAARQYVGQNHELSGAIATTQGLVAAFAAAASGNKTPQDISAAFAGPLVAAAVGAGVTTAGVGAVIVAGVAIAASLLDAAGLGASKPGTQICPSFNYTGGGTPSFAIGCMAVFDSVGSPIAPGSAIWRSFPQAANSDDAWWFQGMPSQGTFTNWPPNVPVASQAKWIPRPDGGGIPIVAAFPNWMGIAGSGDWSAVTRPRDPSPSLTYGLGNASRPTVLSAEQRAAVVAFDGAFAKAWESNCEMALNGLGGKMASDGAVLIHAAEIWNRSHLPGQGIDISTNPLANSFFYWLNLIGQVVASGNADILSADKLSFHLNTGAFKTSPGIPSLPQPVTSKTVALAAAAGVGTAALGTVGYAWLTGMTLAKTSDVVWEATVGKFWKWLVKAV
jgi:hypothetical protein